MNWYKIHIHHDAADVERNVRMLKEFAELWRNLGTPAGLNLFELHEHPKRGAIYYSPPPKEKQLAAFLDRYSAVSSDKPDGATVKPVIGGTKDFEFWFSDK
jgi:hypothetical protein